MPCKSNDEIKRQFLFYLIQQQNEPSDSIYYLNHKIEEPKPDKSQPTHHTTK